MTNPQKENGHVELANEIVEALMRINLSAYETRVLWFIFRKTYGWQKKSDWIALSQFSKEIGLDRRLIHRSLKGLSSKKMIVINRDDRFRIRYGFQKNYEKWKVSSKKMTVINRDDKVSSKEMTEVSSKEIPTKETITKDNITKETISKDIEQRSEYGDKNINWLLKEFEIVMGFKSMGKKDRFLAKHLLNNFTHEQLTYMLKYCATEKYAPQIGSVEKLWYKRGDIIASIKKISNKANIVSI